MDFQQLPSGRFKAAASLARRLALALLLTLFCACAQTPQQPNTEPTATPTVVRFTEYYDPLIGINRAVFAFNDVAYRYALIPASKAYNGVVPSPVRTGIGNFFHNITAPVRVVNHILQLKPRPAGVNIARFLMNTTVGVFGIFDPADAWLDMKPAQTGFEQTLSRYGTGYGTYLVLPFFGPSDLRNGTGRVVDYFLNPIPYITEQPTTTAVMAFDNFQQQAPGAERYLELQREADDPYIFFRNLYLQGVQRDAAFPGE